MKYVFNKIYNTYVATYINYPNIMISGLDINNCDHEGICFVLEISNLSTIESSYTPIDGFQLLFSAICSYLAT